MAIRTDAEAVSKINTEVDDSIDLDPFIEIASALVDEVCTDSDYSDARLELIERWLAAHFAAVNDPRTTLEHAGSVRVFFEGKSGLGLDFTRYGQQAKIIDTAGNLAALDKNMQSGGAKGIDITWLGDWDE